MESGFKQHLATFLQPTSSGIECLSPKDVLNDPPDLIDVSTFSEYRKGHIPGAISVPLFDKAERKSIGIAYHQERSRSATGIGLSLAVPRADQFLTGFFRIVANRWVTVSRAATHYLGKRLRTIEGGYKGYSQLVLQTLTDPRKIMLLGGENGTDLSS